MTDNGKTAFASVALLSIISSVAAYANYGYNAGYGGSYGSGYGRSPYDYGSGYGMPPYGSPMTNYGFGGMGSGYGSEIMSYGMSPYGPSPYETSPFGGYSQYGGRFGRVGPYGYHDDAVIVTPFARVYPKDIYKSHRKMHKHYRRYGFPHEPSPYMGVTDPYSYGASPYYGQHHGAPYAPDPYRSSFHHRRHRYPHHHHQPNMSYYGGSPHYYGSSQYSYGSHPHHYHAAQGYYQGHPTPQHPEAYGGKSPRYHRHHSGFSGAIVDTAKRISSTMAEGLRRLGDEVSGRGLRTFSD